MNQSEPDDWISLGKERFQAKTPTGQSDALSAAVEAADRALARMKRRRRAENEGKPFLVGLVLGAIVASVAYALLRISPLPVFFVTLVIVIGASVFSEFRSARQKPISDCNKRSRLRRFSEMTDQEEQLQRRKNATATLQCDAGGWHVLWYCDTDNNSGYGECAEEARWYGGPKGGREACVERIRRPPPLEDVNWVAIGSSEGPPPYDAATATGMYDSI